MTLSLLRNRGLGAPKTVGRNLALIRRKKYSIALSIIDTTTAREARLR